MQQQARILIVVTKMDMGGAMVLPIQLATELRARGHTVETWYLYRYRSAYENEPGTRIIYPHNASNPFHYVAIFFALLRAMYAFKPDVVHGVLPLGNVMALFAAWLLRCPRRVASHHTQIGAYHASMRWLDKVVGTLGIYTHAIAVSRAVADGFAHYPVAYRRRLLVIQNGVPDISSSLSPLEARQTLGLPADVWLMGTAGRLASEKNHQFLIRVVAQTPNVHLAIAGEGEERANCEALAGELGVADRVHLIGALPATSIPDFLRALNVFVLPSHVEGLPISLIEALKLELAIIASDIPPILEVLEQDDKENAGIVLGTGATEPWASAVADLRDHPSKLKQLTAAAAVRANDFTIDAMAAQYEAVFTEGYRQKAA